MGILWQCNTLPTKSREPWKIRFINCCFFLQDIRVEQQNYLLNNNALVLKNQTSKEESKRFRFAIANSNKVDLWIIIPFLFAWSTNNYYDKHDFVLFNFINLLKLNKYLMVNWNWKKWKAKDVCSHSSAEQILVMMFTIQWIIMRLCNNNFWVTRLSSARTLD